MASVEIDKDQNALGQKCPNRSVNLLGFFLQIFFFSQKNPPSLLNAGKILKYKWTKILSSFEPGNIRKGGSNWVQMAATEPLPLRIFI